MRVDNFMLRPLYSRGSPWYPLNRRLFKPEAVQEGTMKRKATETYLFNPWSTVTIITELS
jgi:hypothetical protein